MEKQWALITGASSGIGFAYAEELAIREKGQLLSDRYGVKIRSLYQNFAIPGAAKVLYDTCQETCHPYRPGSPIRR